MSNSGQCATRQHVISNIEQHTWHKLASLHDEVIAHLPNQCDHLGRSVIVARVFPDEQHGVEHGLKQIHQGSEVIHGVHLLKVLVQRLQVLDCVISLQAGCADILQ